jgi:membrane-associated protease RseP (regulator of RpoE activity)
MRRFLIPVTALVLAGLAFPARARDEPASKDKVKEKEPAKEKAAKPKKTHPYLGLYAVPVEDLSARLRERLKIKEDEGVVVIRVLPDSPAAKAGLRHGDVISRFNGKEVSDPGELRDQVDSLSVGQKVKLTVVREGKKQELTAQLAQAPAEAITGIPPLGRSEDGGFPVDLLGRLRRLERLERRLERLEKRLEKMEKERSAKKP